MDGFYASFYKKIMKMVLPYKDKQEIYTINVNVLIFKFYNFSAANFY